MAESCEHTPESPRDRRHTVAQLYKTRSGTWRPAFGAAVRSQRAGAASSAVIPTSSMPAHSTLALPRLVTALDWLLRHLGLGSFRRRLAAHGVTQRLHAGLHLDVGLVLHEDLRHLRLRDAVLLPDRRDDRLHRHLEVLLQLIDRRLQRHARLLVLQVDHLAGLLDELEGCGGGLRQNSRKQLS